MHYSFVTRHVLPVGSALAVIVLSACSDDTTERAGTGPASGAGGAPIAAGGTAGAAAGSESAAAGLPGSGGGPSAGGAAGMGPGGMATSAGGRLAGTGGMGGAPVTGGSGGVGGLGGIGAAGAAGASGGTGGAAPATGGMPGAGGSPATDRCDVAVYDPQAPPSVLPMSGDLGTHDPTVIEQNDVYYLYQTGPRLPGKRSTDLASWSGAPAAFGSNPGWISQRVPGATDLWAPDLSYFGGQYHLFYSASTFGENTSCIGHATRASMEEGSWSDQGPAICSGGGDNYNAIDPNVIVDQAGTPWLAFGSFWDGIKMVELDSSGARVGNTVHSLASRGGGAIEAPIVVRRCGYYYLFVSFDRCCAGSSSTYNIRVGRSEDVLGPYVDANGTPMMSGGGTLVLGGGGSWAAAGHNFILFTGDRGYNVYHAYPTNNSFARLRVADIAWDAAGWPTSGGP